MSTSETYRRFAEELPHIKTLTGLETWAGNVKAAKTDGSLNEYEVSDLRSAYKARQSEIAMSAL